MTFFNWKQLTKENIFIQRPIEECSLPVGQLAIKLLYLETAMHCTKHQNMYSQTPNCSTSHYQVLLLCVWQEDK
jgi:hypothetical protein